MVTVTAVAIAAVERPRLVSLAEHKPRENVQKGYSQGRYSAIPFFAPIGTLNKKSVAQSK
ncbi:hypothetical protein [Barnesiella sp. CU968]|uniref:hypothetical protein n=1 Tax=Barnesiella sp. CU968 TaxID=2780099 RepID=UPI00195E9A45|nr:hypothetical protein [Barnesiella sp. CU968]